MACNHLENLPEDILLHILSSLPLVDSVIARAVSRQWNKLSKKCWAQKSNLCFDVDNIIGLGKPDTEYQISQFSDYTNFRKNLVLASGRYYRMTDQIVKDFIKGVDRIVQCRQSEEQDVLLGVKSLKIEFLLRRKHFYHVDNWLLSTVTSTTRKLILIFNLRTSLPPWSNDESYLLYRFPSEALLRKKMLCLEYLQLEYISVRYIDGFSTLRTLKLKHTDVTQEDVEILLINSPLLEFLEIKDSQNLVGLQVSSPLPSLKVLILHRCRRLRKIELCAENISSLEYSYCPIMDHVMHAECYNLKTAAFICFNYGRALSYDFPFLSSLYLDLSLPDLPKVLSGSTFAHLKFLALFLEVWQDEKDLQCLSLLLNDIAPILEELELHVKVSSQSEEKFETEYPKTYGGETYPHLKRVVFTGFTGGMGQIKLARNLLMNAENLQVMTLDHLRRSYENFDAKFVSRKGQREISDNCRMAYKFLSEEAPENVRLILSDT